MGSTTVIHDKPVPSSPARWAGWLLLALGLSGVTWWIRTWSKVEALIDDHVSEHGPLPASSIERAALYADGTPAEQQLNAELAAISGLYPWGRAPLALALLVALGGCALTSRYDRLLAGCGLLATIVVVAFWATPLRDTLTIALDILE